MASYSISNQNISINQLCAYYEAAKRNNQMLHSQDIDLIFKIAIENRDLFPGIHGVNTPQLYIDRWIKGYFESLNNPPSKRKANPKTACSDPAIAIIVQETQNVTSAQAAAGKMNHNLFMSAENIQGNLLEEYISMKVRPYGFLWCVGNVLRAVDFCTTDGRLFLQVKNKSNTENSSSSNIREGTNIKKWYRLGTKKKQGKRIPVYRWSKLNELVESNKTEGKNLSPCNMSEEDYEVFLKEVATGNHNLITDQ